MAEAFSLDTWTEVFYGIAVDLHTYGVLWPEHYFEDADAMYPKNMFGVNMEGFRIVMLWNGKDYLAYANKIILSLDIGTKERGKVERPNITRYLLEYITQLITAKDTENFL